MNTKVDNTIESQNLACPTDAQLRWQEAGLGAMFSFDIPVYDIGGYNWTRSYSEVVDPAAYMPTKLDTDQWLEIAKAMGAGYAIFTATHVAGFRQWQSPGYPYGLRQAPWRGGKADIVRDFIESCRRYDIRPALFISVRYNA